MKIEIFFGGIHLTYFDQLSEVKICILVRKKKRKDSREPCLGEFNEIKLWNNSQSAKIVHRFFMGMMFTNKAFSENFSLCNIGHHWFFRG